MSSSDQRSGTESPMTFGGIAVPGEAGTSSVSSSASPGTVEVNVGLLAGNELPPVPESQASTPRKRSLQLEDVAESPETPTTRFRTQITGGRHAASEQLRIVAYQPLRLESAAIQGVEAEEVSDLDLVAYLSVKYDAEVKKSESYRMELFEHRDVSTKLEEMYERSVNEIGELSGYVRQLENVGDQRIMAIVHESEENMALQQRIAEVTDRARHLSMVESQQIALRDQEANVTIAEAREQASSLVAGMRDGFNEARNEFNHQHLMLKHYEEREATNQLAVQEVRGLNERLEMRVGVMNHEYQSAAQMMRIRFESESRIGELHRDEEITEYRNVALNLEMEVARLEERMISDADSAQRIVELMEASGQHGVDTRVVHELRRVQSICDVEEARARSLESEMTQMSHEREGLTRMNARLMALQPRGTATPRTGTASVHSWVMAGNSPPNSEESEAEAQRRRHEMDELRNELAQAESDVDRLRDDRNAYKVWYREEETELQQARANLSEATQQQTGPSSAGVGQSSAAHTGSQKTPSRKEESKVTVPPWPKISDVGIWKMHVVRAVIQASGDLDIDVWTRWCNEAFDPTTPDHVLRSSGGDRFTSIDLKLAQALWQMMVNAGEVASPVKAEIRAIELERTRSGTSVELTKGREYLSRIVNFFRGTNNTEVLYTAKNLYEIRYPGDSKLQPFMSQWNEILSHMDVNTTLPDEALLELLHDKVKGSKLMELDIHAFDNLARSDPARSYQALKDIINRHIRREREEANRKEREKSLHILARNAAPASSEPMAGEAKSGKGPRAPGAPSVPKAKGNPSQTPQVIQVQVEAAAVLPSPSPKDHGKGKKGKGKDKRGRSSTPTGKRYSKGDGKKRSLTPADKAKIGCRFHWNGGCKKGKDCEFSHQEKHRPKSRSQSRDGRGNGRSQSADRVCHAWKKDGRCKFGDKCKYLHHDPAMPAAKDKPKPKKAAPAILAGWHGESDSEADSSPRRVADGARSKKVMKRVRKVRFVKHAEIIPFMSRFALGDDAPKSQTQPRGRAHRTVDVEKKVLSQRGRARRDVETRMATGRGKIIAMIAGGETVVPDIEVRIHDGEWLIGTIDPEDLSYTERDGNAMEAEMGQKSISVPAPEYTGQPIRFILDTGCGHDLISRQKVDVMSGVVGHDENGGMSFMTANGVTQTQEVMEFKPKELNRDSKAYVLDETPAVLSVGKKCMEQGYSFIWLSGRDPYMMDDGGECTPLTVRDNIPYIKLNDPKKRHEKFSSCESVIINQIRKMVEEGIIEDKRNSLSGDDDGREALPSIRLTENPEGRADLRFSWAVPGEERVDEEPPLPPPAESPADGAEPEYPDEHYEPASDGEWEAVGEAEAEEDIGELEIDVLDGVPRLARPGSLKAESNSLVHILTHRYKNPYCETCVRAKMKHRKTRRGAFNRPLRKFGDLISFDYLDLEKSSLDLVPVLDHKVLVVRDRFTGMIAGYSSRTGDADQVVRSLKHFIGRQKVLQFYSDDAPAFVKAAKEMKISHDSSLPGRSQNNSYAERNNQFLIMTVSTCLLHAGTPPCFWKYALDCVCHLLNCEHTTEDGSAWMKMHKDEFKGQLIPFGAKVFFKPSGARSVEQDHKMDPDAIPGIFAGYEVTTGLGWSNKYLVWALEDFIEQNLAYDADRPIMKLMSPHVTEKVEIVGGIEFPLKGKYEKLNTTLDGLGEVRRRGGRSDIPDRDILDDDDDDDNGDDDDDGGDGSAKVKRDKKTVVEYVKLPDVGIEHSSAGKPGDGRIYLNDDGEKVKIGSDGRRYRVGPDGRKVMSGSARLSELFTPEEWQRTSVKDKERMRKLSDKSDHFKEAVKKKVVKALEKTAKKIKDDKSASLDDEAAEVEKAAEEREKRKAEKKKAKKDKSDKKKKKKDKKDSDGDGKAHGSGKDKKSAALSVPLLDRGMSGRYDSDDDTPLSAVSTAVPSDEEFLTSWDEWGDIENGGTELPKAEWIEGNCIDFKNGRVNAQVQEASGPGGIGGVRPSPGGHGGVHHHDAATGIVGDIVTGCVYEFKPNNESRKEDSMSYPRMPWIVDDDVPRQKAVISQFYNAMVSRPVSRNEMLSSPDALASMKKEWKGLWDQDVFDFSRVVEYDEIVKEYRAKNEEVQLARVHGICVEKNHQLPKDDPRRKFKGRGVLLGNQVKNQNFEAALFQDLGNSPATFEAARWADFFGCLPGNSVQMADAIQAYIQAYLTGMACWVELPDDAWPDDVLERVRKLGLRRPVCRLRKALYGHPDSGTMWEKHCDTEVRGLEFDPVGPEWPGMYYHKKLQLLLVIYVDDLKMAGPEKNLKKGWDMLRSKLRIEPETDLGLYLGCMIKKGEASLHDGTKVKTVSYDMSDLLRMTVEKYIGIVGDKTLRRVATPMLPEVTREHPARAPASGGKSIQCPWCSCDFDPDEVEKRKQSPGSGGAPDPASKGKKKVEEKDTPRGKLAPHAASILMKLLYAARIARFDLLRAINSLARNISKWSDKDDARLHHLMCYVNGSTSYQMIGWVGDGAAKLEIGLFADADFAGCGQTLRSTSGAHLHVQGPHTRFPISGGSKRQGCVSHSTPEAEIVAADYALRNLGVPSLRVWDTIVGQGSKITFHDDNQGMIGVMRTGRNPTMRHLERSHGISIVWMHQMFQLDHIDLAYEITARMAADIHTKDFSGAIQWRHACQLINIMPPEDLSCREVLDLHQTTRAGADKTQMFQKRGTTVPTFPYTDVPIVPPEIYQPGLSSREGLQLLPGADPFVMCKCPTRYRMRPPSGLPGERWLRTSWFLENKVWRKVESRVDPLLEGDVIGRWIERAVFQFHPIPPAMTTPPQLASSHEPILLFSLSPLLRVRNHPHLVPLHSLDPSARVVLQTLTRLVHGGEGGKSDRYFPTTRSSTMALYGTSRSREMRIRMRCATTHGRLRKDR